MKKEVGLFGGTFDPIHFGHLNLAFELMEKKHLDEIWFIPVSLNPHKQENKSVSYEHRLNMLQIAIETIPQFKACTVERDLPSPSYTINTLKALFEQNKGKNIQFSLLMGEDTVASFLKWHKPEEIVQLVPLLIGSRTGRYPVLTEDNAIIHNAIKKGCVQTRLFDISGTDLRPRLAQGLYCGHLIPAKVLNYIQDHHLYDSKHKN